VITKQIVWTCDAKGCEETQSDVLLNNQCCNNISIGSFIPPRWSVCDSLGSAIFCHIHSKRTGESK